MPKTVTLRLKDEIYDRFRRSAEADHRSLANLIEMAALRYLDASVGVTDAEMSGIESDGALVSRLRKGSRQARRRIGRFVE